MIFTINQQFFQNSTWRLQSASSSRPTVQNLKKQILIKLNKLNKQTDLENNFILFYFVYMWRTLPQLYIIFLNVMWRFPLIIYRKMYADESMAPSVDQQLKVR